MLVGISRTPFPSMEWRRREEAGRGRAAMGGGCWGSVGDCLFGGEELRRREATRWMAGAGAWVGGTGEGSRPGDSGELEQAVERVALLLVVVVLLGAYSLPLLALTANAAYLSLS